MAQRRMLSLRIVDSARFLQMPLTAHALYFHLALRLNNVNGTKEEREEGDEPKTALHRLPNLEQALEETNLIADDILAALGDQHSQPFYALVARRGTLARKGVYQRNEGIRYRRAAEERNVFAYVGQEGPVPNIARFWRVSLATGFSRSIPNAALLRRTIRHFLVLRPGPAAGHGYKKIPRVRG